MYSKQYELFMGYMGRSILLTCISRGNAWMGRGGGRAHALMELGQVNIIFNAHCQLIQLHNHGKATRNVFLLLTQEIKRNMIHRCMKLPPSGQHMTAPQRLAEHLDSMMRRLRSYLQYIGLVKYAKAIYSRPNATARNQSHLNQSIHGTLHVSLSSQSIPWQYIPIPRQCTVLQHTMNIILSKTMWIHALLLFIICTNIIIDNTTMYVLQTIPTLYGVHGAHHPVDRDSGRVPCTCISRVPPNGGGWGVVAHLSGGHPTVSYVGSVCHFS